MFITAPCVLFLIKQRWSKNKSSYVKAIFLFMAPLKSPEPPPPPPPNIVGSLEFHMADCTRYKTQSCEQFGEVNTAAIRQSRIIFKRLGY